MTHPYPYVPHIIYYKYIEKCPERDMTKLTGAFSSEGCGIRKKGGKDNETYQHFHAVFIFYSERALLLKF